LSWEGLHESIRDYDCRVRADGVNQPGGRIRVRRQATAKMFSSRASRRQNKPRPRQNSVIITSGKHS